MSVVAILGCGKRGGDKVGWAIGHAHAEGWRKADPKARLVAVDPSADNLGAFAERFALSKADQFASTDAMYAAVRPDFVSVCTWPALHAPQVIDAAGRGVRGIACEKPLALDAGEMRAMQAACDRTGARLVVAHQRRYGPVFRLARRLLHEGAIGTGLVAEARVADDWDILSWSVHWFDIVNFFFDAAPEWVLAGADARGERRYGHAVERASVVFAQYPGGAQASFVTGPASAAGYGITVRGSDGMLHVNGEAVRLWNAAGYREPRPEPTETASFPGEFAAMMRELIDGAGSGGPILCDARHCAAATEMAFAAHESARTMRAVSLPLGVEYAPLEVVARRPRPLMPRGRVVLLADEHFGSGGREGIAEALADAGGVAPMLVDAAAGLAPADLDGAGLLALYHTQKEPSEATRSALRAWVSDRKPLLLIHAALGGWPEWDEYQRWCGRVWVWSGPEQSEHPHEPSQLRRIGTGLGTAWAEAWLPRDEVFIRLGQTAECVELATATIPQGTFPAAWLSRQHPNVGVWVPGHRRDLWRVPAMRDGLLGVIRAISA